MERRFYVDTSVWRDYFEDRNDGIRPLGEFAFGFLKNCETNKCKILYSELILSELREKYSDEKIMEMLSPFKKLLAIAELSSKQLLESKMLASKIKEVPQPDILHAIFARDNGAVLITRDRHFDYLRDIAEIKMPEQIIFD